MASIWQRITQSRENRALTSQTIPPRSSTVATAESALTLTAVWRSVQILATSVSNLGVQTKRYATGMEMVVENPAFINNPSFTMNRHQFFYATTAEMALTGNAFWLKTFDSAGRVNEVVLLPSASVNVTLERANDLTSPRIYNYLNQSYTAAQIEHLQLFPRAGWLKSPSPISTCAPDIAGALDLRDYQSNWFSASGVPTGILVAGDEINKADAEEVTANWHTKQATRQIAVLKRNWQYQPIALKPSEALFTEVENQSVQRIARLFGMPARKLLTGIDGTSDTYSNLTDEEHAYYRETLAAYIRPMQDALSNCLPRGTRVEFLWEDLFKADKKSRIEMWKTAIDAGIVTAEYAAQKEGFI